MRIKSRKRNPLKHIKGDHLLRQENIPFIIIIICLLEYTVYASINIVEFFFCYFFSLQFYNKINALIAAILSSMQLKQLSQKREKEK